MAVNVFATNATTEKHLSRYELLAWINGLLDAEFEKIEDLSCGDAYCQLMNMMFHGCLNLKRVKFNTRLEMERIQNFKLLQAAFERQGVETNIPIDKIVRGRFQDNLEFVQFFHKFVHANYDGKEYDAKSARGGVVLGSAKESVKSPPGKPTGGPAPKTRASSRVQRQPILGNPPRSMAPGNAKTAAKNPDDCKKQSEVEQIDEISKKLQRMRMKMDGLARERDFYYTKCLYIEILCHQKSEVGYVSAEKVMDILAATADGFAPPDGISEENEEEAHK